MPIDLAPQNPYGLSLPGPLIAAAGSVGYGVEYARHLDLGQRTTQAEPVLGALVTRSTTLQPQRSRPLPRIIETTAGLLYTGWEHNPGLRYVIERYAPAWATWDLPVIVSIAGETLPDYTEAAVQLEGVEGIAGVEINITSIDHAKIPVKAAKIIAAVRSTTLLPIIVKLPPDVLDIIALAQAVAEAGADAIALIGGMPGLAVDPDTQAPVTGWLCGPAIRPLALRLVATVAEAVAVPVIGIGGIATAADARAFLAVGATAVGVGAALLSNPHAIRTIASALKAH